MMESSRLKRVLVIAGSDSSGGAGLEADQKVIAAHGCYAMTATTALTAQNTQGVQDIHYVPPGFVKKCIDACLDDIGVDIIKCGMLASTETIAVVADAIRRHRVALSVIDPVMVSTSGARLLPETAIKALREQLIPLTTLLTPNIPEATILLRDAGRQVGKIESVDDLVNVARAVQSLGSQYVLLKGGHLPLDHNRKVSPQIKDKHVVVNVLYGKEEAVVLESEYINSTNTHGTGCSLASAIASNLALGETMVSAVRQASTYIEAGIKTSKPLGKGNGPINHFHSSYKLPFAPGRFIDYVLMRGDVQNAWHKYTYHAFVRGLADASLPLENFKDYLVQDYLYLIQFARANALAAYKAHEMEDVAAAAEIVLHIKSEMQLHLDYCADFGLTKEEIEGEEESQACTAYTRYVLEIGQSEDWLALQMALAPCLLGYGLIARRLYEDPETKRDGNVYWKWIETYVAEDYTKATKTASDMLERHAMRQSPQRIEELVRIFVRATKMETRFWDLRQSQ